jgi:hypothetical protein
MRDDCGVRTTLDIDDDVLLAVKEISLAKRIPAGKVVSSLVREGLERSKTRVKVRNGVPVWPSRPGRVVTNALVQQILNEED